MTAANDRPIGVFDSGIGGLTCLKELKELLPHEDIVYLGDTARVPYGTKSRETIAGYARQDIAFLKKFDVKLVLVACGTVSSVMESVPIFDGSGVENYSGVISPAVSAAVKATKNGRIGVIGTPATVRSQCYTNAIKSIDANIQVFSRACPMFVPLVENGYTDRENKVTRLVAEEYLSEMANENVDTLIMGCTHYPLLKDIFSDIMGSGVSLISPGAEAAKYALSLLTEKQLLSDKTSGGSCSLYCTDSEELFADNVAAFLGSDINASVKKCIL